MKWAWAVKLVLFSDTRVGISAAALPPAPGKAPDPALALCANVTAPRADDARAGIAGAAGTLVADALNPPPLPPPTRAETGRDSPTVP